MTTNNRVLAYIVSEDTICVFTDFDTLTMPMSDKNADKVIKELKGKRDANTLERLMRKDVAVKEWSNGVVTVFDGQVYYGPDVVDNAITTRILRFVEEGLPVEPMANFLQNLMANPSYKSREALYKFLEKYSTPITDDGHFIAWKNVRSDFKDIYTGTFDNSPGKVVEMPRHSVDDDGNRTCSAGLHACASPYLKNFYANGSKTVAVKINPRDVVSIPSDYDFAKMRVCRYKVIREVTNDFIYENENSTRWTFEDLLDDPDYDPDYDYE